MATAGVRWPRPASFFATGGGGGGASGFPDSAPASPTAYDEEGDQASLNAIWTAVATPDASFTLASNKLGTFLGMSGPGHATNVYHLRQAIGTEGDYPAAFTVTMKLIVTAHTGSPTLLVQMSNNSAISSGGYIHGAVVGSTVTGAVAGVNDNGSVTTFALPNIARTVYVHYQRNVGASSNVKMFFSLDGLSWTKFATATLTTHVDYIHAYFIGGGASQASGLWIDWLRVNDPRFLQPE